MTDKQALLLLNEIAKFITTYSRKPDIKSIDPNEKRLAEAAKIIKKII